MQKLTKKQAGEFSLAKQGLIGDYRFAGKELSIWPAEDWPYFSFFRERSRGLGQTFDGLEALKEEALTFIREHGPVCSDTRPISLPLSLAKTGDKNRR